MKKLDALAASIAQDYTHQHTATIQSRRRVLECIGEETDRTIVALSAQIAHQRRRRKMVDAKLAGLASITAKR